MNQKMIWLMTVVVALLIVIGAVMVARQRAETPAIAPVAEKPSAVVAPVSQARPFVTADKPPLSLPAPAPIASTTPVAAPTDFAAVETLDEIRVDLSRLAGTLKMSSADIPAASGNDLPRYPLELTCYRKNSSPAVSWQGAPEGTAVYVLVLERRARGEKALWSWIMLDVPATSVGLPRKLQAETLTPAEGIMARNFYDNAAYAGPCDPKGTYLFVLRLFALDKALGLSASATTEEIVAAMQGHILDAAEIRAQHYLQK